MDELRRSPPTSGGVAVGTTASARRDAVTVDLVAVALRGLAASGLTPEGEMPFTLRGAPGPDGPEVRPEGHSLRYSVIVALGLARQPEEIQRDVLGGPDAAELARSCLALASTSRDPGAMALALWAAGEVAGATDSTLAARLLEALRRPSVATVDCAWAVVAGLAMPEGTTASSLVEEGAAKLRANQGPMGTCPHALPQSGGLRQGVREGAHRSLVGPQLGGPLLHQAAGCGSFGQRQAGDDGPGAVDRG